MKKNSPVAKADHINFQLFTASLANLDKPFFMSMSKHFYWYIHTHTRKNDAFFITNFHRFTTITKTFFYDDVFWISISAWV